MQALSSYSVARIDRPRRGGRQGIRGCRKPFPLGCLRRKCPRRRVPSRLPVLPLHGTTAAPGVHGAAPGAPCRAPNVFWQIRCIVQCWTHIPHGPRVTQSRRDVLRLVRRGEAEPTKDPAAKKQNARGVRARCRRRGRGSDYSGHSPAARLCPRWNCTALAGSNGRMPPPARWEWLRMDRKGTGKAVLPPSPLPSNGR